MTRSNRVANNLEFNQLNEDELLRNLKSKVIDFVLVYNDELEESENSEDKRKGLDRKKQKRKYRSNFLTNLTMSGLTYDKVI